MRSWFRDEVGRRVDRSPWLAVVYALATLLAHVEHHHDGAAHAPPRAEAGCETGGVHLAHHPDAPDLSRTPDACPLCQHRAQQPLSSSPVRVDHYRVAGARIHASDPGVPATHLLRIASRAPPVG